MQTPLGGYKPLAQLVHHSRGMFDAAGANPGTDPLMLDRWRIAQAVAPVLAQLGQVQASKDIVTMDTILCGDKGAVLLTALASDGLLRPPPRTQQFDNATTLHEQQDLGHGFTTQQCVGNNGSVGIDESHLRGFSHACANMLHRMPGQATCGRELLRVDAHFGALVLATRDPDPAVRPPLHLLPQLVDHLCHCAAAAAAAGSSPDDLIAAAERDVQDFLAQHRALWTAPNAAGSEDAHSGRRRKRHEAGMMAYHHGAPDAHGGPLERRHRRVRRRSRKAADHGAQAALRQAPVQPASASSTPRLQLNVAAPLVACAWEEDMAPNLAALTLNGDHGGG